MQNHKIINIPSPDFALQELFAKELGISKTVAQVLINRGMKTPVEAESFLRADPRDLLDPYSFPDMRKAVSLIREAARTSRKVMLFGDYDVDGITALAVLQSALARAGITPVHYIPHRIKEGYGLSGNIASIARQKGIGLVITVDCGTNSGQRIKELRGQGIEVIVTDHHEQSEKGESPASAVINPKAAGSPYKYRDLAGVGVAYKLAQALAADEGARSQESDLDLVALGTIADVVPLTGENRIFAKEGLRLLSRTNRPGLRALAEASGIKGKEVNAGFVSYILGPRLNASGRMDSAETALRLLTSSNAEEANELARQVEFYNRQRQKVESKIMEEAQALIDKEVNFREHKIIVIAKEDWHQGVLGIVASKLADRFYRPTILISLSEGLCKGSGRSIPNFHLFDALLDCKDFLAGFGGHAHAAGIMIPRANIADFKEKINLLAKERLRIEDLIPAIDIDAELALAEVGEGLVWQLRSLEPYGSANQEPLFLTRNLALKGEPQVLSRYTLKFWVTDGARTYQAIGFGMASLKESLMQADGFDLVYRPEIDSWDGHESLVLEVSDIFFR